MRTNIVFDDKLMADALKATGLTTKKDAVEEELNPGVAKNSSPEPLRCFYSSI